MPMYSTIKRIKDDTERNRIIEKLLALRTQLDRQIPTKTATDTLLLATWNIRAFGDNRSTESLHYIAEIVSRFDLVAVQEVAANMDGLCKLVTLLGPNWDYIVTDSTEGTSGGGERMAFIYDKCKVFFRKMAGEIVLPETKLVVDEKTGKNVQFARTPFCVAFQAGWFKFILTTVHIYYGTAKKDDPRRIEEITSIVKFLSDRAKKEGENYILLGDFNIFNTDDTTMKILTSKGFYIPAAIREHPSDLGQSKHYDQIAFNLKIDVNMTVFSEGKQHAGAFNYSETIYPPQDLHLYLKYFDEKYVTGKTEKEIEKYYLTNWRTFEISDHLPLWIELKIDFSNQFLQNIPQTIQKSPTTAVSSPPAVTTNVSNVEETQKQQQTPCIGNKNSKTFHLTTCKSVPMEENRIYFDSQQTALNASYKPCNICKP